MLKYHIAPGQITPSYCFSRTFVRVDRTIPKIVSQLICQRFPNLRPSTPTEWHAIAEEIYRDGIMLTDEQAREIFANVAKEEPDYSEIYQNTVDTIKTSIERHNRYLALKPPSDLVDDDITKKVRNTISLGFPRRSGKSTAIRNLAKYGDVIISADVRSSHNKIGSFAESITQNSHYRFEFCKIPPITVWMDEPQLMTENIYKIYNWFPVTTQFVKIGTF